MKKYFILLVLASLVVGSASATAFSSWSAYGDAWKATNDTYTLVMWNATGSHSWVSTGNASSISYLVVAGGGAGGTCGNGAGGGGGGAGGFIENTTTSLTGIYNITVGFGGSGTNPGQKGGNSTIGNATYNLTNAEGGGRGGGFASLVGIPSQPGGSGGGAGYGNTNPANVSNAVFPPQYGNAGGNGISSGTYPGGGGGGAGAAGSNAAGSVAGSGGAGRNSTITGVSTAYSCGGGGGTDTGTAGAGGCSYAGAGSTTGAGNNAVANTGSGGGGATATDGAASNNGGSGGSGIVIISYPSSMSILYANFTSSPNPATVNFPVTFTDTSTGAPVTWNWTFGEMRGTNTSTSQNPTHIYTAAGNYTVMLNCTNASGIYNNYSHYQLVNDYGVGFVDDFALIGVPATAKKFTIDPRQMTITPQDGNAINSISLNVPIGTTGTFTIDQGNGITTQGSFSYTGWPRSMWVVTIGESSYTEVYTWTGVAALPMRAYIANSANTSTSGAGGRNSAARGLSLAWGQVPYVWEHVITAPAEASPMIKFQYNSDNDITVTYTTSSIEESIKSLIGGYGQSLTDTSNGIGGWVLKLKAYAEMLWGVFLSGLYWLKFLFIDNLVMTVSLYTAGTLAYATLTSRNPFQILQKWFRMQERLFRFMVEGFNYLVGIVTSMISIIK